jgi:hypothetical protein
MLHQHHHKGVIGPCLGNIAIQAVNANQPLEPRFQVLIRDLSLHHPPKICWIRDDSFYIRINLDGRTKQTSPTSMHHMSMESVIFDEAHHSAAITLELMAHRRIHEDVSLGTIRGILSSFMGSNVWYLAQDRHEDHHCESTQFSFSIDQVTSQHIDPTQNSETQGTRKEATGRHLFELASDPMIHKLLADAQCFAPLLEKMYIFTLFAKSFAEIHPYAQLTWNIMSTVVQMAVARKFHSHHVKMLFDAIEDAYGFVSAANGLEYIESNRKIIKDLSEHTADCAQYIKSIAGQNGFEKIIFTKATQMTIKGHIDRFLELKTSLSQHAAIQTAATVNKFFSQFKLNVRFIQLDDVQVCGAPFVEPQ